MNNEGDTAGHGAHGIVSPALVDALVTGHHPPDVQLAVLGGLSGRLLHPGVVVLGVFRAPPWHVF